jgi:hypothetical protein
MCLLLAIGIAVGGSAIAQGMMGGTGTGTMREGTMQGGMGMHGGMMGRKMMGREMNCPMGGGMLTFDRVCTKMKMKRQLGNGSKLDPEDLPND